MFIHICFRFCLSKMFRNPDASCTKIFNIFEKKHQSLPEIFIMWSRNTRMSILRGPFQCCPTHHSSFQAGVYSIFLSRQSSDRSPYHASDRLPRMIVRRGILRSVFLEIPDTGFHLLHASSVLCFFPAISFRPAHKPFVRTKRFHILCGQKPLNFSTNAKTIRSMLQIRPR